jgi:hypothetical protein
MGDDSAMQARWSDAWVLAAVDWAADADLAKIITAADAINHAIPMIEEIACDPISRRCRSRAPFRHPLTLTDEGRRIRRTEGLSKSTVAVT